MSPNWLRCNGMSRNHGKQDCSTTCFLTALGGDFQGIETFTDLTQGDGSTCWLLDQAVVRRWWRSVHRPPTLMPSITAFLSLLITVVRHQNSKTIKRIPQPQATKPVMRLNHYLVCIHFMGLHMRSERGDADSEQTLFRNFNDNNLMEL